MRMLGRTATVLAAFAATTLVTAFAFAGTAGSAKVVRFGASYSGRATVKVDGASAAIAARGVGSGTLVGASRISGTGTGDVSVQPCPVFSGVGAIAAAGGAKLEIAVKAGSACPAEADQNQISLSAAPRSRAAAAGLPRPAAP